MDENIKKVLITSLSAVSTDKGFPDLVTVVISDGIASVFYSKNDYYDGYCEVSSEIIKLNDLTNELKKNCDDLSKKKTTLTRDVEQLEKAKNTILKQLQKFAPSK